MSVSHDLLHSKNFDLCRICLLEPEADRNKKFIDIFQDGPKLSHRMFKLLGITVKKEDDLPKILCEYCHESLISWHAMKKKASSSQIVLNYITKKNIGHASDVPGTSQLTNNESDSSEDSRSNVPSTTSRSHTLDENKSKVSSTHINFCSSSSSSGSSNQSNLKRLLTTQQTKPAIDFNDDSSCEVVDATEEVILVSSDSEKLEGTKRYQGLHYCSICKMKNNYDHDCFQYNNEFCTCLVPNCNILAKSFGDIASHIRQHMGMPSGAILCNRCFQENKISERDVDGYHTICRRINNLFKCYACNKIFDNMAEFATHKLKQHKGQLRDNNGNYLCLYCEISSSDMMMIVEHQKYCREFQNKKEESLKKTALSDERNVTKRVIRRAKETKHPCSSKHFLFTCLKPSCKLVFQNFNVFKSHHREHFGLGNNLICWQCCTPFSNLNGLRLHQVKGNCRTPGTFKCHECSLDCDNLQSLSIHKYTMHNGELLVTKKGKKTVTCAFCKTEIKIINLKSHLINCKLNKNKTIASKPKLIKPGKYFHKCLVCGKKCLTAAALTSHKRIHKTVSKTKQLTRVRFDTETNDEMDQTLSSSTSQMNTGAFKGTDEKIVPISSNTYRSVTESKPNFDMFPYVDGLYSCVKCPKKFRSKKGLSMHWPFCSNKAIQNSHQKTKTNLVQNYYCTKCEEFYTRLSFGHHWKINHGSRLPFNKNRRYSCTKCSHKFLYKIALTMHIEYVHSELQNSVTLNENVVTFPIVSETTSLATANEDNYLGHIEREENADTIQKNNDEELEMNIDCNTNEENSNEDLVINNNDNKTDDGVNCSAQRVNQVNDSNMEIANKVTNEDAMEVDSTNEIENNIETANYEKTIKIEFTDDDSEQMTTSVEIDSLDSSGKMEEISNSQNFNETVNEHEMINSVRILSEGNQGTNNCTATDMN